MVHLSTLAVLVFACGTCPFCLHCVTPVVLTPLRCKIPHCHGCACDLLVRMLCEVYCHLSLHIQCMLKVLFPSS